MSKYNSFNESHLLFLLKEGDQDAFSEVYNRYFHVLYLHAYNRLREKEQAKDIVQELFSFIWLKYDVIEFKQSLSGYLYASIRNRILNYVAHNKLKFKYELSQNTSVNVAYEETDFRVRERQLAAIIEKEIQALPEKMRLVFELSRKENLSHKEIGEKLGVSEQTVRAHIKHALKLLRSKLGLANFLCLIIYLHKL